MNSKTIGTTSYLWQSSSTTITFTLLLNSLLLDTGCIPYMGFEPQQNYSDLETVNKFTERMRMAIKEVKSVICKAQDNMKKYYDCRRTLAPVF